MLSASTNAICMSDYKPMCNDWSLRYSNLYENLEAWKSNIEVCSAEARKWGISIKKINEKIAWLDSDRESVFGSPHQSHEVLLGQQIYLHELYCKQILRKTIIHQIKYAAQQGRLLAANDPEMMNIVDRCEAVLFYPFGDKIKLPKYDIFIEQYNHTVKELNRMIKNFIELRQFRQEECHYSFKRLRSA